jgi:hypothetical protein
MDSAIAAVLEGKVSARRRHRAVQEMVRVPTPVVLAPEVETAAEAEAEVEPWTSGDILTAYYAAVGPGGKSELEPEEPELEQNLEPETEPEPESEPEPEPEPDANVHLRGGSEVERWVPPSGDELLTTLGASLGAHRATSPLPRAPPPDVADPFGDMVRLPSRGWTWHPAPGAAAGGFGYSCGVAAATGLVPRPLSGRGPSPGGRQLATELRVQRPREALVLELVRCAGRPADAAQRTHAEDRRAK